MENTTATEYKLKTIIGIMDGAINKLNALLPMCEAKENEDHSTL